MTRTSFDVATRRTVSTLSLALICFGLIGSSFCGSSRKAVLLKDVKVLTLYSDRLTAGSKPIPQLRCTGRSGNCRFAPDVVQCVNVGSDGIDAQWKCEANLHKSVKFGRLDVSCEGFNYPNDPYIVQGSCGLTYTLESTLADSSYKPDSSSMSAGFVFTIFLTLFILYLCCRTDATAGRTPYPPGSGPSFGPSSNYRPSGPPPPGFKTDGDSNTYSTAGGPAAGAYANDGPGFWSGLMAGGGLGYLFGRTRDTGPDSAYDFRNRYGSRYSGYSNYPSYGYSNDNNDSDTHTSSGFAGTSRR